MNITDTRDLRDRLDELKAKQDEIQNKKNELAELNNYVPDEDEQEEHDEEVEKLKEEIEDLESDFDEDEQEELAELEAMESEIPEWRHGETLIPEGCFVDYCEELCKDIGDMPRDMPWYIEIDWEKTAENIKADYSEIEYQGTTHLYRS